MLRWSTQIHKWLGLVVGLQVLGWVLGGLVMTAIPIEVVRSEHRLADRPAPPLPAGGWIDAARAAEAAGFAPAEATLKTTPRGLVWVLKAGERTRVLDARTGRPLPALASDEIQRLARQAYRGGAPVAGARFHAVAPQETGRDGPLWRVDFDDAERTAFYLSPETGEVVTRRSNVWRLYDAFWRIHILDFRDGENFNHPLIIGAAFLTLPMVITGLILLWIRLSRDLHVLRGRRGR